jgi:hypothetical protein
MTHNTEMESRLSAQPSALAFLSSRTLATLNNLKQGAWRVGDALMQSLDRDQALTGLEIRACSHELANTPNGIKPIARCRKRSCPMCTEIKARQRAVRARRALSYLPPMRDEHRAEPRRSIIALKVNLNSGQACDLSELRARLSAMSQAWSRLLRIKALEGLTLGALKAVEITPSPSERAHPHIHGVMLLRGDLSRDEIDEIDRAMRRSWQRSIRKLTGATPGNTTTVYERATELSAQTESDLLSWLNYCAKGGYDLQKSDHRLTHEQGSANFWQTIDEATKGARMFSASGELREALGKAKHDLDHAPRAITPTPRKADYVWSDKKSAYIDKDQAEYEPYALTQSTSYAHVYPHFSQVFIKELEKEQERQHRAEIARKLQALKATPSRNADLFLNNRTTSKHPTEHYTEPTEIRRAPPTNGSPISRETPKTEPRATIELDDVASAPLTKPGAVAELDDVATAGNG